GLVHEGVVLHLAVVTEDDAGPDVGAAADDAVRADPRPVTHLCEVPHTRALADVGPVVDVSGGLDDGGCGCAPGDQPRPQPCATISSAGPAPREIASSARRRRVLEVCAV